MPKRLSRAQRAHALARIGALREWAAVAYGGDRLAAAEWMFTPAVGLDGATPADVAYEGGFASLRVLRLLAEHRPLFRLAADFSADERAQ